MKKFLPLLAVLAAAAYHLYVKKSDAYKAYEAFLEARRSGNCPNMNDLLDGSATTAKAYVDVLCPPAARNRPSAASLLGDLSATPADAMRVVLRTVEAQEKSGDEVRLVVLEKVGGRKSAMMPLPPPVRHRVKLKKSGASWKLVEFASENA